MKTIKVRIAVAVDPDGDWNSCGSKSLSEDEAMELAGEPLSEGEARYWVTAELRVPEIAEVAASVERS